MRASDLAAMAGAGAAIALLAGCPPRAATSQPIGGAGGQGVGTGGALDAGSGGGHAGGGHQGGAAGTHALRWALRFGDAADQAGEDVRIDAAGNVVVAASFTGTVSLGGASVTASVDADGLVVKLSPQGAPVWSRAIAGGVVTTTSIALRADGTSITGGRFGEAIQVAGGPTLAAQPGQRNAFAAALRADGSVAWADAWGYATGSGSRLVTSIDADDTGAIALAGHFKGKVDIGSQTLTTAPLTEEDTFVMRLDPAGAVLWSAQFGGASGETWAKLAVDRGSGEIAVLSQRCEATDAGDTCSGATLRRLDAVGATLWSRPIAAGLIPLHQAIAVGAGGDAVIAGGYAGTFDAGCGALPSAGAVSAYVVSVKQAGCGFSRSFGGQCATVYADGIASTADGRLVVAGTFLGVLDLGDAGQLDAGSERAVYVLTLAADGAVIRATSFPATGDVATNGVATNGAVAVITGRLAGELRVGAKLLTSSGGDDAFVIAVDL